jgi:hypothetical protein
VAQELPKAQISLLIAFI